MAIKKTTSKSTDAAGLLQQFQKDFGEGVGSFGGKLLDVTRIPTGLFPLDLALGGGFPRGRASIVYGPESSGKTNIALLAIANHQRLWPDLICVYVDLEGTLDPKWASTLGVNMEKLVVLRPSYAEQMVDMVEGLLMAEDIGLVVIDSLAAMVTTQELDSSAEKANVGGAALVTGKLVRKSTHAFTEAEKAGRYPTLLYINQTRNKIGVMYGNPETQPGGNAPQFQASIRLRVYGKNVMDSKVSNVLPVIKEIKFVIQKHKCPILAIEGIAKVAMLPHAGLLPGQCDDFNTISEYLKTFGMFEKGDKGKGWVIIGDHYPTIAEFKSKLYEDFAFGTEVRQALITRLFNEGGAIEAEVE